MDQYVLFVRGEREAERGWLGFVQVAGSLLLSERVLKICFITLTTKQQSGSNQECNDSSAVLTLF